MNARAVALMVVRDVFPPPGTNAPERGAQEALEYRARKAHLDPRDRAGRDGSAFDEQSRCAPRGRLLKEGVTVVLWAPDRDE